MSICRLVQGFQKMEQNAGAKWLIHGTKHHKDNQPYVNLIERTAMVTHWSNNNLQVSIPIYLHNLKITNVSESLLDTSILHYIQAA